MTTDVRAGESLQAALNAAQPGDLVRLEAAATFQGNHELPVTPSGPPIRVTTNMPLPDRRLTPADTGLAMIRSGNGDFALCAGPGRANWIFDGVQFGSNSGGYGDVIQVNQGDHLTFDRLVLVADVAGQKRGIQGNGTHIILRRSHIANIWREGQDSQAFCAWDGAGPYTVVDSYLEAAGENIMFGGANSASAAAVPADILVENNHCSKRDEWRGQARSVKNLFELKSAKRVIIRGNLFEHNWTDAQSGNAIVFTTRNDEGQSPWSVIEDVVFEHNTVRDTEGLFNILGYNDGSPSGRTTRVVIRHNLCLGSGRFALIGGEVGELTFDHNTVEQGGNFFMLYRGDVWPAGDARRRLARYAVESLTVTNTLGYHNAYGVKADEGGMGTVALDDMAAQYHWTHNVLAGEYPFPYPEITWKPTEEEHAKQFTADYGLIPSSVYCGAGTDGADLGTTSEQKPPPPIKPEPEPTTTPVTIAFPCEGKTITLTVPATVVVTAGRKK